MLQLLNPRTPNVAEAQGFIAPWIRVALHIGYAVAWISETTNEMWGNTKNESATRTKVIADLEQAQMHLSVNDDLSINAFVNQQMVDLKSALNQQLDELVRNLPEERIDAIIELQTFCNNLAYVGARFETHVTGSAIPTEGRNA